MSLSCIVTVGLAGVICVTLVYYFVTEWNADQLLIWGNKLLLFNQKNIVGE